MVKRAMVPKDIQNFLNINYKGNTVLGSGDSIATKSRHGLFCVDTQTQ